ncbi:hypothetical protein F5Y16DRAFT_289903 [Xylariaceae sp. FL0255]|nr:hypothetical protein F5Y16DRAFT_289903 [Xylariaceae sp. FL0255]
MRGSMQLSSDLTENACQHEVYLIVTAASGKISLRSTIIRRHVCFYLSVTIIILSEPQFLIKSTLSQLTGPEAGVYVEVRRDAVCNPRESAILDHDFVSYLFFFLFRLSLILSSAFSKG